MAVFNLQTLGSWTKEGILQTLQAQQKPMFFLDSGLYNSFSRSPGISSWSCSHTQVPFLPSLPYFRQKTGQDSAIQIPTETQSKNSWVTESSLDKPVKWVKRGQNFYKPYHYLLLIERRLLQVCLFGFCWRGKFTLLKISISRNNRCCCKLE